MAITKIKHRGLRELFAKGHSRRIGSQHQAMAQLIMDYLDRITDIDDCIGVRDFHSLKGDLKGQYAMSVTGNWRITFTFGSGDVIIENFTDYH